MFSGIGVTFPGVLQEFTYDYKNIEFGLKLEQAIPVSRSYSTKVVESEETPSLFFEELFVDYNFSNKSRLSFNLGYFAFYDLPSVVAESSSLHGNIVSRQGPNESFFVYPFQGWSVSSTYCLCSNESYDFSVKFEYLNNVKAPSNYADASSLLLSLKHHNQISITDYELYVFEQKKQAAPSFYMSELFGYSNRAGVGLEAKHTFTKNNFFIGFSWVESRIIEVTPEQADQRTIQIYLGVDNA